MGFPAKITFKLTLSSVPLKLSKHICKRYNRNDFATSNFLDKPKKTLFLFSSAFDADVIMQMSASVSIHFKKTSAHRVAPIPIKAEGRKSISTQCQKDYYCEIKKSANKPSIFVNIPIAQVQKC